jgi:uncharacterized membrane protein
MLNAQYAKGCKPDIIDTNMVRLKDFSGLRAPLPSSYSLETYAPSVGNQGQLGSCTSWAANYCAFTIVKRIEAGNINLTPFSALDLHNRIKSSNGEPPCSDGASISQALEILKSYGAGRDYMSCSYASANKFYQDRLYDLDYMHLSITDVKKALFDKNPVIIAANCYKNDWGLTSNHINGVWNGVSSGDYEGGHAMCVIGYDDNKSGGAFKVQNSWGTTWGTSGYFWIRYSDFFKTVYQVNSVSPKPGYYKNDEVFGEATFGSYFRVQNDCSLTVYVSISQNVNGQVETVGWYSVVSGSSIDIDISDRNTNEFYWMATATNNGNYVDWYDVNGSNRCVSRDKHFIEGINSSYCPLIKPFYREDPTEGTYYHYQYLTCPNINTRGGEIQLTAENSNSIGISKDLSDKDNINWKQGALMDPYSGKQILEMDSNGEKYYSVFYIKKGKIFEFNGDKEALQKLNYLKFANQQNAEYWLKSK